MMTNKLIHTLLIASLSFLGTHLTACSSKPSESASGDPYNGLPAEMATPDASMPAEEVSSASK